MWRVEDGGTYLRGTPPALHSMVGGGSPMTLASNFSVVPADIVTSRRLRLSILGATGERKMLFSAHVYMYGIQVIYHISRTLCFSSNTFTIH